VEEKRREIVALEQEIAAQVEAARAMGLEVER
jgi:hypothetical protein